MAEARRCDRCNSFYMLNDDIKERGEYPITADFKKSIYSLSIYDSNNSRIDHKDLCPKCSRSLIVWLNDHGQYNDTIFDKLVETDIAEVKDCYKCKYYGTSNDDIYCGECDEDYSKFEPKEGSE